MIKVSQLLKPAWVKRQYELLLPFLPHNTSLTLRLGDKRLLTTGDADPNEANPDTIIRPLMLEGTRIGVLLLSPPTEAKASVDIWSDAFVHVLQGMIDIEHARRAVGQETLESYREMALLQRAVSELNHLLKPAAVAATLLKEFTVDHGALFLRNADDDRLERACSVGDDTALTALQGSRLFSQMAEGETGDIISDMAALPLRVDEIPLFRSLLWLPLIVHGEKLGLLVLAASRPDGFSAADMKRAQTLVAVAAGALRNAQLYAAQETLFRSFVQAISSLIDAKSPYTNGHCRRVQVLSLMLAEAAHRTDNGPLAEFVFDEDERTTLEIAAMLHDCGKVVTPEWVVDKATKLSTIVDRMDLVALRFDCLRLQCPASEQEGLDDDLAFLRKCNLGGEFMSDAHIQRVHEIGARTWCNAQGETSPLLTEDEVRNLCIQRGTLNEEERKIIEDHARHTINMLSQIAFPRALRNVTAYAGGHHERMDGRGYPNGLKGCELPVPARIMAIADTFEALTAPDRPYRKGDKLSWAIGILRRMKDEGHLDPDLLDLFLSQDIHRRYAEEYLVSDQRDQL